MGPKKISKAELEKKRLEQAKFEAELEMKAVRKERDEYRRKYEMSVERIQRIEATTDFVRDLDLSSVKTVPIEPKTPKGHSESAAIFCMGDWHLGENVDPRKVNYRNEYNLKVAEASITNAFRTGQFWVETFRNITKIPHLVINFGGDLITGFIHDDQKETAYGTPMQQALKLYGMMKSGIDFALKQGGYNKIVCICNVGNHSRDTKKMHSWNMVEHSYEWMVYNLLAEHYAKQKRIEFVIADGTYFGKAKSGSA